MNQISRMLLLSALALWLLQNSAMAGAEKRVALVVGIANYQHVQPLKNPVGDAAAIAAILRRMQFHTVDVVTDANTGDFNQALHQFSRKAASADVALVYFAGHGISIGGTNYLIPADAKLASETDVDFEAVSLDVVLRSVSGARRLRVVLLDACRNNPFANKMYSPTRTITRGLQRVEPESDTVIAFAAKDGVVASDGDGANSPFTHALLRNLSNGNEIRLLLGQVRDDVRRLTGGIQNPYVSQNLGGSPVYLSSPSSQEGRPASTAASLEVGLKPSTPASAGSAGPVSASSKNWNSGCQAAAQSEALNCAMEQRLGLKDSGKEIAAIVVQVPANTRKPNLILRLPLEMNLAYGATLQIDANEAVKVPIRSCDSNGCIAAMPITESMLSQLLIAKTMSLTVYGQSGKPIKVPFTMSGFAETYSKIR